MWMWNTASARYNQNCWRLCHRLYTAISYYLAQIIGACAFEAERSQFYPYSYQGVLNGPCIQHCQVLHGHRLFPLTQMELDRVHKADPLEALVNLQDWETLHYNHQLWLLGADCKFLLKNSGGFLDPHTTWILLGPRTLYWLHTFVFKSEGLCKLTLKWL